MTSSALETAGTSPGPRFDVHRIRRDFPILRETIREKPLVYLDSAASAQKPSVVLDAMRECMEHYYANVHRGVHRLSERSTVAYEKARESAREFLNAAGPEEIVFVRGTTEGINLVAQSYARNRLVPGDEVLLTGLEHHSNIVPWQLLCEQTGAVLQVAPIDDRGEVPLEGFEKRLSDRTRIAAFAHISNALGTVNPVGEMTRLAQERGAVVLVDGAQAAPHVPIDVQSLGCDFYAFSGHKAFGPTGIGVLYGKAALLDAMPPYQGGGEMIRTVSFEKSEYADAPFKFEAGTPNIVGAIGLGAALDYIRSVGYEDLARHEEELRSEATRCLSEIEGVRLIGTAEHKAAVVSFELASVHAHDVGTVLDSEGIAVRTGHHCAQPVMDHFGVAATVRASFAMYNTLEEVDALVRGLERVRELFA